MQLSKSGEFIAKFDSSGTLQWQKTLVGKYQEKSFSVAVGPDGSVYVCVYQYDPHGAVADLMVEAIRYLPKELYFPSLV